MTPSTVGGHLGYFYFGAFVNEDALKNSYISFFGGQGHVHSRAGLVGIRV